MEIPYDKLWIYEYVGRVECLPPEPETGFLGCWLEGGSAFLFFDRPSDERAREMAGAAPLREQFEMSYLEWQGGEAILPFQAGTLMVRPPWLDPPLEWTESGHELLLDPGVVFGSGNHPTTRHSLASLVSISGLISPPTIVDPKEWRLEKTTLDLGCGTGILSIAAAKLGAVVKAVDLNPLCVETTRRNVELNGLSDRIEVIRADALDFASEPAELVMANLESAIIDKFATGGGFRNRHHLILSGLTRSHVQRIRSLAAEAGYGWIEELNDRETWYTLLCNRTK